MIDRPGYVYRIVNKTITHPLAPGFSETVKIGGWFKINATDEDDAIIDPATLGDYDAAVKRLQKVVDRDALLARNEQARQDARNERLIARAKEMQRKIEAGVLQSFAGMTEDEIFEELKRIL